MKLATRGLLFIFILCHTFAFAQTSGNQLPPSSAQAWKVFDKPEYSIQFPESWRLDTSGQMGTRFFLLTALTSDKDQLAENINLIIQDLKGLNIDLDKYAEISENQIKTMITHGNILESKRDQQSGLELQKVIFTGEQGSFKLKYLQYYIVKNEKAFVLTLTCEVDEYDHYKTEGEQIMKSFHIK